MKNLIVVLLLLAGASWLISCNQPNTPPPKPREKSQAEIIQSVKQSVVTVIVRDEAGQLIQTCSGVIVAPPEPNAYARVVTCLHCFNVFGADSAEVILSTGAKYPVRNIVAEDARHDLLKLSIELPGDAAPSLPLAEKLPEQGESIFVISSPNGIPGSLATGIVS
ncbi:MAG: S1 family peptidase, partial [Blastocatellia bacterium]